MIIRPGWDKRGARWTRKRGNNRAIVRLGRGGWHWAVFDSNGNIVQMSDFSKPTKRSRKARKAAEKVLLSITLTPVRLPELEVDS